MGKKNNSILPIILGGLLVGGIIYYLWKRNVQGVDCDVEDVVDYEVSYVPIKKAVRVRKAVSPKKKKVGGALNTRQTQLYRYITKSNGLTTSDMLKKFSSVTDRTLRRDLNRLMASGIIVKSGSTKSSKYYQSK